MVLETMQQDEDGNWIMKPTTLRQLQVDGMEVYSVFRRTFNSDKCPNPKKYAKALEGVTQVSIIIMHS